MRRVVIPSIEKGKITKQPIAQPISMPLVPLSQEGTMVERAEPAPERTEPEGIIALVIEIEAAIVVSEPKTTPFTILMPNIATASQEFLLP